MTRFTSVIDQLFSVVCIVLYALSLLVMAWITYYFGLHVYDGSILAGVMVWIIGSLITLLMILRVLLFVQDERRRGKAASKEPCP